MATNINEVKPAKKKHKVFLYVAIACFVIAIVGAIIVIAVL